MNSHAEVINSLYNLLWIRISVAKVEGRIINEIIDAGKLNIDILRTFFLQSKDTICFDNAIEILNALLPEIVRLTTLLSLTEVNGNSSDTEHEPCTKIKRRSNGK